MFSAKPGSMQIEQGILFMKPIKKIKINDNLEIDETENKIGKIYLNRLSKNFSTDELKSYFIKFERGSKSKIHLHDSDQIIIGMGGVGEIEILSKINGQNRFETKESLELKEYESVLIPSGLFIGTEPQKITSLYKCFL
jgi:hypothetical protein